VPPQGNDHFQGRPIAGLKSYEIARSESDMSRITATFFASPHGPIKISCWHQGRPRCDALEY